MTLLRDQAQWWLNEADRLDKAASEWSTKPPPTAPVDTMTAEWIQATLGPDHLRHLAQHHRAHAARLARKANDR